METKLNFISHRIFKGVLGLVVIVMIGYGFKLTRFNSIDKKHFNMSDLSGRVQIAMAEQPAIASDKKIYDQVIGVDARPLIIEKYLEKYHSPLLPYADLIFNLSQTYGFEYYWIVAIAQQESNLCKKAPENSFNCWGYGIHQAGTLKFDNYEIALKSFAEYLKREYFDKGYNTAELIMEKYCPNSSGSWAYGVNQFIEEMESGNF
ncbi:MAG TPA: hypothetical protein PK131_02875 [Candidatus Woesebacteria bacterium]|nr:hypothetical protein [Candidatus Woesebacteria bacterium]HRS22813.1 hypothetical protein [Candidatus Woesebacteria bacterium]HRT40205.1 hypothetical protein [Candidatus Woesebacteria bacterium]